MRVRALGLGPGFRGLEEDAGNSWQKSWWGASRARYETQSKCLGPPCFVNETCIFPRAVCPEAAFSSCGPPSQTGPDPDAGRDQCC